jgi:alpha-1,2-rhamnosyltransferase
MIGTVEPRKNHRIVLKWYLNAAPPETKLTVIGKLGWLSQDVEPVLRRESKKKGGITWIQDASDEDMAYEMLRHEIGIMASHAEGLGLPILEYSAHGLKLVLNDIPIFREVAGEAGFYFEENSIESLDNAIKNAFASKEVLSIPEVSWKDTALEVLAFLKENRDS